MEHKDTLYTMRGLPVTKGKMHRKFSKALGTQCQCDGNCRCGYVKHHRLHCGNCGWNEPYSYNVLTDKFVCPSCKTESCINPNKSNIEMNNQENLTESSFSQGVVGLGMGNDGFLLWNKEPLGANKSGSNESNFTQETVAYAIGSQGMALRPFSDEPVESNFTQQTVAYAIGEQGMSLNPFSENPIGTGDSLESNFSLKGALVCANPLSKDVFCGRYCKSLGYLRSNDKSAFKRCKASCKINCQKAKQGKWKYPAAPEGIEEEINPADLATKVEKEVASAHPSASPAPDTMRTDDSGQGKGKMTMWIIIAAVVVILIIAAILLLRKRNAA